MPGTRQTPDYYPPPEVPSHPQATRDPVVQGQQDTEESVRRSPGTRMLMLVCILLIFVSLAFILRGLVFTIRNIKVHGISQVSWQDVAISAGLGPASNYFNLDEGRIREGINSNRYLVYQNMKKVLPNTLVLYVRERQPSARINYIGIAYIMADDGMILERTKDLTRFADLMTVSGMAIGDIRVGNVPLSTRFSQVDVCVDIIRELGQQGFLSQMKDLNVANPASIYMTSIDGYSIHIGDAKDLQAKIGTVRAVLQALRKGGYPIGVIEATVPGEATYRPDSVSRMGRPKTAIFVQKRLISL
jgi:cell division protein FtsQ